MSRAATPRRTTRVPSKAKPLPRNRQTPASPARARAVKTARLEARIKPELRDLIQRAAELAGRTFTEFVTETLHDAAQQAIAEAHVLRLSLADQELFAQALIAPPGGAPALERAFARHSELVAER